MIKYFIKFKSLPTDDFSFDTEYEVNELFVKTIKNCKWAYMPAVKGNGDVAIHVDFLEYLVKRRTYEVTKDEDMLYPPLHNFKFRRNIQ